MKVNKRLFDSTIEMINKEVAIQLPLSRMVLSPFKFESLWNIITSGIEFKEIFTDPNDENEFNELLDELNEMFEYDLETMPIDAIYCAGFDIACIVSKNPTLNKFKYNYQLKVFELNN